MYRQTHRRMIHFIDCPPLDLSGQVLMWHQQKQSMTDGWTNRQTDEQLDKVVLEKVIPMLCFASLASYK